MNDVPEFASTTASQTGTATVIDAVTRADLGWVRRLIRAAGVAAKLSADDVDSLVLAVSEVAGNAILHAGAGSIAVQHLPDGLLVEIRDTGPGLPPDLVVALPAPDATGGRGLWLAQRLCARVDMLSSPSGLTVRLYGRSAATGS